jgi:microcystin-dependent protein
MALPEFVRRSYAGGCQACQLLAPMGDTDLSFTIQGNFANYPTGANGPFAMSIDDGLSTVEKVFCESLDVTTGIVTVVSDISGDTGRGYDGTPANAHVPLTPPAPQVRPCWTAAEAAEANLLVAYILGTLGGGPASTGEVLTWNSGGFPDWEVPGGEANLMPIGGIALWGAGAAPTNWHLCDGSVVSRTTYATLFSLYGSTWGAGDGSTTFNLPDLRNKFPIGASTILAVGKSGGSQSISTSNMPSHAHTITDPMHDHQLPSGGTFCESASASTLYASEVVSPNPISFAGSTTENWTGIVINPTGGGTPYLPPAAGVNFIIRVL